MTTTFAEVNVPLQKLHVANTSGFAATCKVAGEGLALTFNKTGDERRLLAIEGLPAGNAAGAKAAEISYQLDLTSGAAPRAAVLIYEKGGASWYKLAPSPAALGAAATARVSLAALQQTAFSKGENNQVDWGQVERVWAGFVFDGPAEGKLLMSGVRLTDQTALPTQALRLTGAGPGAWTAGADPAVKGTLTMAPEGPEGAQCLKYEFNVPAGRHMYAIPSTNVTAEDLEGYSALRFKYRAQIVPGMRLLVNLGETNGVSYFTEPPAPWASDWTELTLPLSQFKWASWGPKDTEDKVDLARLVNVQIGTHGVPEQAGAGLIMVCDVELVP
jgi:hypothetical protein